jgi:hypothetical protein
MPKRPFRLPRDPHGFGIEPDSQGRAGPLGPTHSATINREAITRTVSRTPEVMVKVSGGGRDIGTVMAHIRYIDRHGKLAIHTDDDTVVGGKSAAQQMIDSWHLNETRGQYGVPRLNPNSRRKLVHNLVLSMPAGTSPEGLLAAAKQFAHRTFADERRYLMVLHTDQSHPHVHVVVQSEGRDRRALKIKKATLQSWRTAFAECLREQGIAANATPRALRGKARTTKKDPIYRAARRGASTFQHRQIAAVAAALKNGIPLIGAKTAVRNTWYQVDHYWRQITQTLKAEGDMELARATEQFRENLPPPHTEQELIAARLLKHILQQRNQTSALDHAPPARLPTHERE